MKSWRELIYQLEQAARLARACETGNEQAMDDLEDMCATRQYRGAVLEWDIDGLLARGRENDDEVVSLADITGLQPPGVRIAE